MGWSDTKSIENIADLLSWDGCLLMLASLLLLVSNQRSFSKNLTEVLEQRNHANEGYQSFGDSSIEAASTSDDNMICVTVESVVTSSYKAVALSLAATAFLKETFGISSNVGKYLTLAVTLLLLFGGSFASEMAVYIKPYLKNTNIIHCLRGRISNSRFWSHMLVVAFNFCDTALYFNTFDKFRQNLQWSDHRLSNLQDSWDKILFGYAVVSSGTFLVANQITFSRLVNQMLTSKSQLLQQRQQSTHETRCKIMSKNTCSYNTTLYKSIVITLAFMEIIFVLTRGNWLVTAVTGVSGFAGILAAQHSIFAPPFSYTNKNFSTENYLDSPKSKSVIRQ